MSVHLSIFIYFSTVTNYLIFACLYECKKLPSARFDDILNFTFEVEAHSWFSTAGEAQGDGLQVGEGIDSSVP